MTTRIASPATTYSLSNGVRDLKDVFNQLVQDSGGLLSIIGTENRDFFGAGKKMEWMEDVRTFETDIIANGAAVLAADTEIGVTTIDAFQVGMIITFVGYTEEMYISAINTSTSKITVTRSYNGATAPTTIADGTLLRVVGRPVGEFNRANANPLFEPEILYNYYEKFREDMPFSGDTMNFKQYGFATPEAYRDYNIMRFMKKIRNRLDKTAMLGERSVGSSSSPSRMRGLYTWLTQTGTNKKDLSGGAVTATNLNDMLESIYTDDTEAKNVMLYMNFNNARQIATFNTALANRIENAPYDSNIAAGAVHKSIFRGDLSAYGDSKVVVDKSCPTDCIFVLNTEKIKLVYAPKGQLRQFDSTPSEAEPEEKQDGLVLTASLKVLDHKYSHGLIYNTKRTL